MRRVAVLKGGRSLERQISLKSAERVEQALRRLGHQPIPIDADTTLVEQLRTSSVDVAFIAIHGRDGEDGTVQELLEILGIPYTGSRIGSCIRCSDKVLTKHLLTEAGIPTPEFYAFSESAFSELGAAHALPEIESRLGLPIVAKPASQGSALGVKFASSAKEVPEALLAAFSYDSRAVIERYIPGRDLAVSVIELENGPVALPTVEAVPQNDSFYDFEARYEIGRTAFICPAELPSSVAERAVELALKAYKVLNCYTTARIDMMLDRESSELYVIEVDTVPGLTQTSLLPQAAEAYGLSFEQLIERQIELALAAV